MGECESKNSNTDKQRGKKDPPELQFAVKKLSDLKVPSKRWEQVEQPIYILLLTVDKNGFYAAFTISEKSSEASN